MNKFDEREKSFEKKFQLDEELQFKIAAKSNKYLGEWVSSKLGKTEEEKKEYIQELIKVDLEKAGNEDVFKKIFQDFKVNSISIDEVEIRDQMDITEKLDARDRGGMKRGGKVKKTKSKPTKKYAMNRGGKVTSVRKPTRA